MNLPIALVADELSADAICVLKPRIGSSRDRVGSGECRDYAGVGLVTVGRRSLPAMRYASGGDQEDGAQSRLRDRC